LEVQDRFPLIPWISSVPLLVFARYLSFVLVATLVPTMRDGWQKAKSTFIERSTGSIFIIKRLV